MKQRWKKNPGPTRAEKRLHVFRVPRLAPRQSPICRPNSRLALVWTPGFRLTSIHRTGSWLVCTRTRCRKADAGSRDLDFARTANHAPAPVAYCVPSAMFDQAHTVPAKLFCVSAASRTEQVLLPRRAFTKSERCGGLRRSASLSEIRNSESVRSQEWRSRGQFDRHLPNRDGRSHIIGHSPDPGRWA